MAGENDGRKRAPRRVIWWLLPLILAAIAVALIAVLRGGDGTSPSYPLY